MSVLRTSRHYDLKFKLQVVEEVLSGRISKETARRVYGIKGHSTISKWIHKLEGKLTRMDEFEESEFRKRIQELEKLLEHERLKRQAAEEMIKVAEKELKISIRKKSNTKQLKR